MAETYHIGQYRYAGEEDKTNSLVVDTYPSKNGNLGLRAVYKDAGYTVSVKENDRTESKEVCFQDVLIENINDGQLISSKDMFFMELSLSPFSIATSYVLKLVNKNNPYGDYEVIQRFNTNVASNSGLELVKIVLYCPEGSVGQKRSDFRVAIVADDMDPWDEEIITGFEDSGCTVISTADYEALTRKNSISLLPSWNVDVEDGTRQNHSVGFASRYYKEVFDSILLEIVRDDNDYDMVEKLPSQITGDDSVKGEYEYILGRYLNVTNSNADQVEVKIYKLTNIVSTELGEKGVIKKMGLWGKPGLQFMINGEQILIPSSGMIELEGIDITSVGVYATSFNDRFVIDYQYIITD